MSTIQRSLTRQQFSVITSSLLQSPQIARSFMSSSVSELESSTAHCSHSTVASV